MTGRKKSSHHERYEVGLVLLHDSYPELTRAEIIRTNKSNCSLSTLKVNIIPDTNGKYRNKRFFPANRDYYSNNCRS